MSVLAELKICFLAGTLGQGGAERQLYYTLIALKDLGADLTVLSFTSGEFWQNPIEELGIPVIWLGKKKSKIKRLVQIIDQLRHISPSIVHSQHFYTNLYLTAAARWLSLKEIGTVRSDGLHDVSETGRILGILSIIIPRTITVNSHNAIKNIKNMGHPTSRLYYIPNVVNTKKFVSKERPRLQEIHLLMVGRLGPPKRFDSFLMLLAQANKQFARKIVGHVVGGGPDKQRLQNLADQYGLESDLVHFHGVIPDIERLYRDVDIFVHLSDWEGLPNTILEAMSSGLPVIATRVGGIPEVVIDGITGILVNPGDENKLLLVLDRLITDPKLRSTMGIEGRAFIEKNHSLNMLPIYLERFYESVLK